MVPYIPYEGYVPMYTISIPSTSEGSRVRYEYDTMILLGPHRALTQPPWLGTQKRICAVETLSVSHDGLITSCHNRCDNAPVAKVLGKNCQSLPEGNQRQLDMFHAD